MKAPWFFFPTTILVFMVFFSGCEVIFPPTIYVASPTKIRYDISYGYQVNCSDVKKYEINYISDIPTVLRGSITYDLLYQQQYQTITLLNNSLVHWNISGTEERTYNLGITAHVIAESYLVADLNGDDALTTQAIQAYHPTIVNQYTQPQVNQSIRYIDPDNPSLSTLAKSVVEEGQTNNSFLQAKSLFAWLKENIRYQLHPTQDEVQPAAVTFQNKNGDCDDLSFLYISLCRSVGIPARFIRGYLLTQLANGNTSATAHAWTEVFVGADVGNNGWIPVECACTSDDITIDIEQNFGVEDAFHLRLFVDDGSNQSLTHYVSNIQYTTYNGHIQSPESFVYILSYQELESQKLIISNDNIRSYER